ncbi:oxidoreductase [Sphaerisporangium corydalis]|uniref:Oxidoreductase n=1 Tax=Sphaerisporangium corydalis TaxID=1441875 RepID=A0ABV9ECK6_9ACTN|nr:oxidoreductase [Sphaerisporangium corydalis]
MNARWTGAEIGDQRGRTAVVTGGNTGIGFETAKLLAEHGATVLLACRDLGKAEAAAARIGAGSTVIPIRLDLASLASVREAAERIGEIHPRLDLLVNNAGMIMPPYTRTEDGFELHFGTNHLGHYALTGLLLELLLPVPGSRVVTVSSIGHRRGEMKFGDLQLEHGYKGETAYFQSKLANLMFAYELQRRLASAGAETISLAAHPGNARTDFGRNLGVFVRVAMRPGMRWFTSWLLQSPHVGALASVRAAVDPAARGGEYYGPPGRLQFTGHPERVESSARSYDTAAQRRLWEESERLTGVVYRFAEPSLRHPG